MVESTKVKIVTNQRVRRFKGAIHATWFNAPHKSPQCYAGLDSGILEVIVGFGFDFLCGKHVFYLPSRPQYCLETECRQRDTLG